MKVYDLISLPRAGAASGSPPVNCDEYRGGLIVGFTAVLLTITVSVVALRFTVRLLIVRSWFWDDWFMLAAIVSNIISA